MIDKHSGDMIVLFRRTGQRRYAVEAVREDFPDLVMNPAPGYDPLVPHDLLHLVVEAVMGLRHGVFGQLAAGGDAGTFRIKAGSHQTSRERARQRRRIKKRSARLAQSGTDEDAQSERAAYVCWQTWLARSSSRPHQAQAQTMAAQARHIRALMAPVEAERLDEAMDNICGHLDALSAGWCRLSVGEAIQVRWPDLSVAAC